MSSTLTLYVYDGPADQGKKIGYRDGVRLAARGKSSDDAEDAVPTDRAGNISFMRMPDGPYTLYVDIEGFEPWQQDVDLPLTGNQPNVIVDPDGQGKRIDIVLQRQGTGAQPGSGSGASAGQRGRLSPSGPIFRVDGQPWRWCSTDGYALLARLVAGEDIDPFLEWVIATGFNMVRVFGVLKNITDQMGLPPLIATPAQVELLLQLTTARGLRVELTAGDFQLVGLTTTADQKRRYYDPIGEVVAQFELAVVETCNEPFKNGVDVRAIGRIGRGIVQATGDYDDNQALDAPLDFITRHPGRDNEWPRKGKDAKDFYDKWHKPTVNDESMGADEENKPGSRSNVINDFFDCGACDALMGAGGTFHATDLVYAKVPRERQQLCAQAYVAGQRAIPLDAPLGDYAAGHLANSPLEFSDATSLRTFARLFPFGTSPSATAIVIRPANDTRTPQNGWRIVAQRGPGGRVVDLTR